MSTMMNVQNSVRLDRLQRLADYLETQVTDEHFNMGWWANGLDPKSEDFCGCAGGHATAVFSGDGLILDHDTLYPRLLPRSEDYRPDAFLGNMGSSALRNFFSLSQYDTEVLFGTIPSRCREAEINLIRDFILTQEIKP